MATVLAWATENGTAVIPRGGGSGVCGGAQAGHGSVIRGAHLPHRHIAELRAGRLRVEADAPFPVEADGELLGTTPASFGIIPAGLRLKV